MAITRVFLCLFGGQLQIKVTSQFMDRTIVTAMYRRSGWELLRIARVFTGYIRIQTLHIYLGSIWKSSSYFLLRNRWILHNFRHFHYFFISVGFTSFDSYLIIGLFIFSRFFVFRSSEEHEYNTNALKSHFTCAMYSLSLASKSFTSNWAYFRITCFNHAQICH